MKFESWGTRSIGDNGMLSVSSHKSMWHFHELLSDVEMEG